MTSTIVLVTVTVALSLYAQSGGTQTRRAEIRGGGGDGKCTIEVEVDDQAEVEIRGDTAILRTYSGQRARWRRFECNQVMPARPADFRYRGVDGRGRQDLARDPRNGGSAVIRIDDPKGGSEGYTFDIEWRGGGGAGWGDNDGGWGNRGRGNNGGGNNDGGWGNNGGNNGGGWGNNGGNNGGGWGNSGGGGNWNGNSGSTFSFRGDGNGSFQRRNGRDERIRDVEVSLSRDGRVRLSFEAQGYQRINFAGRADRYGRDSIYTELRGSNTGGNTRGSATIYVDNRGEVQRIEMTGRNNNDDFRLQWRAR